MLKTRTCSHLLGIIGYVSIGYVYRLFLNRLIINFMKATVSVFSLGLLVGLFGFAPKKDSFRVEKTFSDRKIRRIEQQVSKRYGQSLTIKVLKRNERNEISSLNFQRFQKNGEPGGGCSSDDFGVLVILSDGCTISDAGYEKEIPAK